MDELLGQDLIIQLPAVGIPLEAEQGPVDHLHQHPALDNTADLFLKCLQLHIRGEVLQITQARFHVLVSQLPCISLQLLRPFAEDLHNIPVDLQNQLAPVKNSLAVNPQRGQPAAAFSECGAFLSHGTSPLSVRKIANILDKKDIGEV